MSWLSLVDYSNKYKVSISTLRRKIKLNNIKFKLDAGKYFILEESEKAKDSGARPKASPSDVSEHTPKPTFFATPPVQEDRRQAPPNSAPLIDELKKAYTLVLQEKEEQIRQLREEIADLRTLIKVLEGENERLKAFYRPLELQR